MENLVNHIFGAPWDFMTWLGVIVLVSVGGGLVTGTIAIITSYYRDRARDEMDATLKMEMLQRGMSADEIQQVLKASSVSFDPSTWASDCDERHSHHKRRGMRKAMREMGREQHSA